MASIRYYNQTAPFWDFVANLEHQGADHPFFASRRRDNNNNNNNNNNNEGESSGEENNAWGGPWGGPWGGWGGAHRGWHRGPPPHGPHHHHRGPPGPPQPPPAYPEGENQAAPEGEKSNEKQPEDPSTSIPADGPSAPHQGRPHPRCGGRHGGRGFRGRGGHCGRGAGGPPGFFPMMGMGGPFLSQLSTLFQTDNETTEGNTKANEAEDFRPEADVFDTETAYIVHVSLPGAKKEDVAVSWDAEKSELAISGVVHRPGDEELLKTLALDERRVGAFERKVRLGSRANPAQVDVDEIRARMEEGILRIEVPKLDKDYVEIKKVDIE